MDAYENSHCLQAQAAGSSGGTCSGGEPSAQSSTSPTPDAYSSPDRMMALSRLSRFGMTFEPLTVDRGAGVLMWCLAGSHVRTSVALERAQGSKVPGLDCGWKWPASFARYDPDSSSWKTRQCSLLGGLESYSETWPRWGSMRNGECLGRTTLAPRIGESASGLPAMLPTPTKHGSTGRGLRPAYATGNHHMSSLEWVVMNGRPATRMWPTPTARDWKSGSSSQQTMDRNSRPLSEVVHHSEGGGSLSPTFVEWLMGWLLGWTDFAPLATGKSRQWLRSHGACCPSEAGGHD